MILLLAITERVDPVWSGNKCGTAFRVFNNRDTEGEKKQGTEMKKQAALLAAAICSGPGNLRKKKPPLVSNPGPHRVTAAQAPKLGRDQCAYCKQELCWKRRYPNHPQRGRAPPFSKCLMKINEDGQGEGIPQKVPGNKIMSPEEPWVTLEVEGEPVEFLLDIGATLYYNQKGQPI